MISSHVTDDGHRPREFNQSRGMQSSSTVLSLSKETTSNGSLNKIIEALNGSSIPIQLTPNDPDCKQLLFEVFETPSLSSFSD